MYIYRTKMEQVMFIETFKKISEVCYLPHFSIIHFKDLKNILYFPNFNETHNILGKWSSKWYQKEKYLVGYVEQDDYSNIYFIIKRCYEIRNDNLIPMNLKEFAINWKQNYSEDILLNPIIFTEHYLEDLVKTKMIDVDFEIDEKSESSLKIHYNDNDFSDSSSSNEETNYNSMTSSTLTTMTDSSITSSTNYNKENNCLSPISSIASTPKNIKNIDTPISKFSSQIEITRDSLLTSDSSILMFVSKTNKPDVYWVYNEDKQYITSCLIPNIKTSSYMNKLFSNKSIDEFIKVSLKYHEKTKKYIPILD